MENATHVQVRPETGDVHSSINYMVAMAQKPARCGAPQCAADSGFVQFMRKALKRRGYEKAERRVSMRSHPLRMCC